MKLIENLKTRQFWIGVLAEFLAVLLLIVIGCSSCKAEDHLTPNTVRISLGLYFFLFLFYGKYIGYLSYKYFFFKGLLLLSQLWLLQLLM